MELAGYHLAGNGLTVNTTALAHFLSSLLSNLYRSLT